MKKLIITIAMAITLMSCGENVNESKSEMVDVVDTFTVVIGEVRNYEIGGASVLSFNNTTDNYYPTITINYENDTLVYGGKKDVVIYDKCSIIIESGLTKADSQQKDIGAHVYLSIK